jgi:voltage-gated potassium channel Kch
LPTGSPRRRTEGSRRDEEGNRAVTLTTVGFGDIVPIMPAARLATGLEAIVGQLYLAVVIATLVGRVAARRG